LNLIPAQISDFHKSNLEGLIRLTEKSFDGIGDLVELNWQVCKSFNAETMNVAKRALTAKDMQEFVSVHTSLLQPKGEKSAAYSREVRAIALRTQSELSSIATAHLKERAQNLKEQFELLTEKARTRLACLGGPVKSVVDATVTACGSMQSATTQSIEAANNELDAALKATIRAANSADSTKSA
jgi:phasin family protein